MPSSASQPLEMFARVLDATGGAVERLSDPRQIAATVARLARAQGVREVLYQADELAEQMNLKLLLAAHGIELLAVETAGDKAGHARLALTGAELAIAETGTLLVGGRPGGWGLAAALPWVHVVLLPLSALVADLPTAFDRFAERMSRGERDWVWITGPSRTADIGHTLVMGAHGPNALHVLVVG